jgi:hypothetical protein
MITPAEQPQWDAFTQVMRDNAQSMADNFKTRGAKLRAMNAAEDMQSYADMAQLHAQNMQKLSASFQTLYGVLSDSQKQAADKAFHDAMAERKANTHS